MLREAVNATWPHGMLIVSALSRRHTGEAVVLISCASWLNRAQRTTLVRSSSPLSIVEQSSGRRPSGIDAKDGADGGSDESGHDADVRTRPPTHGAKDVRAD